MRFYRDYIIVFFLDQSIRIATNQRIMDSK